MLLFVSTGRTSTITDVPWLDADEMAAWRAYAATVFDLNAALEGDLAEFGLTLGDYQVLVFLSEAEDHSMRMCDLAAHLQLSPSGLTRRLDGLVRGGLVERHPSLADRRVMLAHLTDEGMAFLEQAAPTHVRSVRARVIDRLDRRDLAAMARIWNAIRDGLLADESCIAAKQ
jgi:DNA-binding MarR family transcriptional regulator